jgi:eukaryotic-like serine/threonine-protein kinase
MARRRSPRKKIERAARAFDRYSPPNPLHGEVFDGVCPGDEFAGFEYQRRLGGNSGQSAVARVQRPADGAVLAMVIPIVNPQAALQRIQAEIELLKPIHHYCIPWYESIGYFPNNRPYLLMEFIPGEPVVVFANRKRLGIRSRLKVFVKLCGGVEALNEHHLIHLGLKPDNVLTTQQRCPKIIDFGAMLQEGHMLPPHHPGTSRYKAPERYGHSAATPQMDVFSLGVILYELVVAFRPFSRHAAGINVPDQNSLEVAVQQQPEAPSALVNYQSGELAARCEERSTSEQRLSFILQTYVDPIALKSVAKDPAARYPSARDLASAINEIVRLV